MSYISKEKFQEFKNNSDQISSTGYSKLNVPFQLSVAREVLKDYLASIPKEKLFDISSDNSPYKTYAYIADNSNYLTILSEANMIFLPEDSSEMFAGGGDTTNKYIKYRNLDLRGLDSSKVVNMEKMFANQEMRLVIDNSMRGENGNYSAKTSKSYSIIQ